jgi:hypothetical protein
MKKKRKEQIVSRSIFEDLTEILNAAAQEAIKRGDEVLRANIEYALTLTGMISEETAKKIIENIDNPDKLRQEAEELLKRRKDLMKLYLKLHERKQE